MLICKVCNPSLTGNGYCGQHSTSGSGYYEETKPKMNNFIEKKSEEFEEILETPSGIFIWPNGNVNWDGIKSFLRTALQEAYSAGLADRDDAVMTGMKLAKSQSLQERALEEKLKEE